MLVRSRRMNKKLIASLLALGLVFGPVTGAINETYATEASVDENDKAKRNALDKIAEIKGYSEKYKDIKSNPDYRLADTNTRDAFNKAMEEAVSYAESYEVTLNELDGHIAEVKTAKNNLYINAKSNLDKLKDSVIKSEKVIANNPDSSEKEDYRNLEEKIKKAKYTLKNIDKVEVDGESLVRLRKELDELSKKAIDEFNDTNDYKAPTAEERDNLGKEPKEEQASPEDKNLDLLIEDIKILIDSHQEFVTNGKYTVATDGEKKAYDGATAEYNKIVEKGLSSDNYDQIYTIVTKFAQAKHNIDGEKPGYKVIRLETKDPNEEKNIIEVLKKLREYINTKDDVVKGLEDAELKRKYIDNVDLAQDYSNYYALGNKKSLDTYKELEAYLSKLKAEIDNKKNQNQGPNNIDAAKKGLEELINRTKGIVIDDFYGTDQKNAKESYIKNRDEAIKAKDNKDASLDDLTKAYESFNKSITELSKFLIDRLQKLVDEDKDFRESDKFKKANENVVTSYDELIKKAKEEIAKTEADANDLNKLYRDLNIAKEAIEENLSEQARRLKSAISESESFKNKYKDFGNGLEGPQKTAKKRYEELINKAKELDKAGKLDSDEAKTTLELIENTKAFIEGKISEKKYLSNKYYHILKELKNQKGYEEKVNQAARDRIDEALKLYEKGEKDEETIYSALDAALKEDSVKEFINEINKSKDPNKTRDELLAKLRTLAEEEENFKAGEKYKNAPKELKADYDKALEEAKKIIEKENPTEAEIKDAYEKLKDAVNKIEIRHIIDRRLVVLADKFKENQLKIKNPADRKAIADKINALKNNPYTTMEEVEKVEAELDKLIKTQQAVTTTTIAPQSQAPAGQVPTTTRPISTVTNPGSIVKTGINGIAKVAAVLAVAAIILKLISKKGEKDETNK